MSGAALRPVEEVLAELLAAAAPLDTVTVELDAAVGHVLARDVTATTDLPRFDNAAMDGFAVVAADTADASEARPARLRLVGATYAGAPADLMSVEPGTACTVATGAPLPPGADAVVRVERATRDGDVVLVRQEVTRGADVRRRAEDLVAGALVLRAGTVLGPGQIAAAAGIGTEKVAVRRPPDVTVVLTGDEVHRGPGPIGPHGVHDAIGPALAALLRDGGAADVHVVGPVPDDRDRLRRTLAERAASTDLLVTVGGVSKGGRDHLTEVLAGLGTVSVDGVALRPGRPFRHGRVGGTVVTCLPGNPAAALVTATLFTLPVVAVLAGRDPAAPAPLPARLTEEVSVRVGTRHWLRAVVREGPDGREVRPAGRQGSAMLHSLAAANAWLVVPPEASTLARGATVDCLPMWGDLGRAAWRTAPR